jgi:uncharacterized lipoprotein
MMKALTLGLTLAAVLVTAGCNPFRRNSAEAELCKDALGYAKSEEGTNLKVPPGLEAPDTRGALRIPDLNVPEPPPRTKEQGCLDQPPSYTVAKPKEPEA